MKLTYQMNVAKDGKPYFAVHAEDVQVSEEEEAVDRVISAANALVRRFNQEEEREGRKTRFEIVRE